MISLDRASYQVQPRYAEYVGLSTDVKPVEVDNGDEFQEINTGFVYKFDETNGEWVKQPTGGGGGGGTNDYNDLINLPQINGVELIGNKTSAELGLANSIEIIATLTLEEEAEGLVIDKDSSGLPFELTEAIASIQVPITTLNLNTNFFYFYFDSGISNYTLFNIPSNGISQSTVRIEEVAASHQIQCFAENGGINTFRTTSVSISNPLNELKITQFRVANFNSLKLPVGTIVILSGRRK